MLLEVITVEHEKEVVTLKEVKTDVLKSIAYKVRIRAFLLAFYGAILTIWAYAVFYSLFLKIIAFILWLGFVGELVYMAIQAFNIRKENYLTIRTDVLIRSRDRAKGAYTWIPLQLHRLYFNRGYYDISSITHHRWSYDHEMDAKAVYDTSFPNDSFTLVGHNEKIYMAYNHRFFDVQVPQQDR